MTIVDRRLDNGPDEDSSDDEVIADPENQHINETQSETGNIGDALSNEEGSTGGDARSNEEVNTGGLMMGVDEATAREASARRYMEEVVLPDAGKLILRQKESIKRFIQKEGFKSYKFVPKESYNSKDPLFREAMQFAVGEDWDRTQESREVHFNRFGGVVDNELKRKRQNVMGAVRIEMKRK